MSCDDAEKSFEIAIFLKNSMFLGRKFKKMDTFIKIYFFLKKVLTRKPFGLSFFKLIWPVLVIYHCKARKKLYANIMPIYRVGAQIREKNWFKVWKIIYLKIHKKSMEYQKLWFTFNKFIKYPLHFYSQTLSENFIFRFFFRNFHFLFFICTLHSMAYLSSNKVSWVEMKSIQFRIKWKLIIIKNDKAAMVGRGVMAKFSKAEHKSHCDRCF